MQVRAGRTVRGSAGFLASQIGEGRLLRLCPFLGTRAELAKKGCREFEFVDRQGRIVAVLWTDAKLESGIVFEPGEGAPVVKTARGFSGGPRQLTQFVDRRVNVSPPPWPQPPPAVLKALKAFLKKGAAPDVVLTLVAKWSRPSPGQLDAVSKRQLAAAAKPLGVKSLLEDLGDRTLERLAFDRAPSLVGWVLDRADGVIFEVGKTKPTGLVLSEGEVHDEAGDDRQALVKAMQRALR